MFSSPSSESDKDLLGIDGKISDDTDFAQDILPVSNAVFNEHTKWYGLMFRERYVERAYLDDQARLQKNVIFFGYLLYAFILLSNLLYGYVTYTVSLGVCRDPNQRQLCVTQYGVGAWESEENLRKQFSCKGKPS